MRRRLLAWSMTLVMAVSILAGITFPAKAATIATVRFTVKYCQTDSRTELKMINDFRASSDAWVWNEDDKTKTVYNNLSPLEYDYQLEKVAMQRCAEIALEYGHTRPDGNSCWTTYDDLGYTSWTALGENIAAGHGSPAEVFEAWQETNKSYSGQGHRRSMLNPNFNRVGVAGCYYNGRYFWVQEFSQSSASVGSGAANDSDTLVSAKVDLDRATVSLQVASSLTIPEGGSVNLPEVKVTMTLPGSFAKNCPLEADVSYKMADTSIASISGNTIKGLKGGKTTMTVSGMNKTATVNIEVSHQHSYTSKVTAPTCTEKGYTTYTCANCGDSYESDETAALGHDWELTAVVRESCEKGGREEYKCTRCETEKIEKLDPIEHEWNEGIVTVPPTADKEGTRTYTCKNCERIREESIPALGQVTEPEILEDTEVHSYKNTSKGLQFSWDFVAGADGYDIYRRELDLDKLTVSDEYVTTVDGDTTSYTDTTVTNGSTLAYFAKPYRQNADGSYIDADCSSSFYYYLKRPSQKEVAVKDGGLAVSWNKNSKAEGYMIYRSVDGGSYKKVKTIKKNSTVTWTDEDVKNGSSYKYKVYAYTKITWNDIGTQTYKSYVSAVKTSAYLSKASITSLTNSASKAMTVKWKKNSSANGYEIQYSLKSDFSSSVKTKKITKKSTVSAKITGLTKGKTYYVRVRSYKTVDGSSYYGSWSIKKSIKIKK